MGGAVTRVPGDVLVHLRNARDHVDRAYAEPLDLDALAAIAGVSKYHFHRLFAATYGLTPAATCRNAASSERRICCVRRTSSVTEVCHAVGYTSLGSFSARFRQIVGETPSQFQARWGANAPRIPGCYVLMWGLAEHK